MKLDYNYYLSKVSPPEKLHSYHLALMALRMGIKLELNQEADLIWIANLCIAAKVPQKWEALLGFGVAKDKLYQKICYLKPGEFPGDKYFMCVLAYQRAKRMIFQTELESDQIMMLTKSLAWIKLKYESGKQYYFNFVSKQKMDSQPNEIKEVTQQINSLMK